MKGLSTEQRRRFDERGLVKLDGLLPRGTAEEMADYLWQEMARKHGIRRHDPSTWRRERPAQFGAFQKTGAFNAMATPALRGVLDDLIGEDLWDEPRGWGLPLVCFPTASGPWDVPDKIWHLDLTPDPRHPRMMVGRVFVLLAPLRAKGGGTLVATGSHRFVAQLAQDLGGRLSSLEMRKRLIQAHAWFADLMSAPRPGDDRIARFIASATVADGMPLQIEEMTGEPGDVFLMHPHALHGLSANALDAPRLALTQTVYPKARSGA